MSKEVPPPMLRVGISPPDPDVVEVLLRDWSVRETADGGRHFVGFNPQLGKARVSSPIVAFDSVRMTGTTRSGRVYTLFGAPENVGMTTLAWSVWCMRNGIDPTTTRVAEIAGTASPAMPQ